MTSSAKKRTPRLRARTTISKTCELVNGVRSIVKMKRTPRAVDGHVHHGSDDSLGSLLLSGARQNVVKVRTYIVEVEWIKNVRFPSHYPETIYWDKYVNVPLFREAAPNPRD